MCFLSTGRLLLFMTDVSRNCDVCLCALVGFVSNKNYSFETFKRVCVETYCQLRGSRRGQVSNACTRFRIHKIGECEINSLSSFVVAFDGVCKCRVTDVVEFRRVTIQK